MNQLEQTKSTRPRTHRCLGFPGDVVLLGQVCDFFTSYEESLIFFVALAVPI